MKLQELIKWAEEHLADRGSKLKEQFVGDENSFLVTKKYMEAIIIRAVKVIRNSTESEKLMKDLDEYTQQLAKRGVIYGGEHLSEGEQKSAKSKKVV